MSIALSQSKCETRTGPFFKLNRLLAGLVILKGTVPACVPAVPALTTIYLYSSRWQLVLCMPTDCQ